MSTAEEKDKKIKEEEKKKKEEKEKEEKEEKEEEEKKQQILEKYLYFDKNTYYSVVNFVFSIILLQNNINVDNKYLLNYVIKKLNENKNIIDDNSVYFFKKNINFDFKENSINFDYTTINQNFLHIIYIFIFDLDNENIIKLLNNYAIGDNIFKILFIMSVFKEIYQKVSELDNFSTNILFDYIHKKLYIDNNDKYIKLLTDFFKKQERYINLTNKELFDENVNTYFSKEFTFFQRIFNSFGANKVKINISLKNISKKFFKYGIPLIGAANILYNPLSYATSYLPGTISGTANALGTVSNAMAYVPGGGLGVGLGTATVLTVLQIYNYINNKNNNKLRLSSSKSNS